MITKPSASSAYTAPLPRPPTRFCRNPVTAFLPGGVPNNAVRINVRLTEAQGRAIPLTFGRLIGMNSCEVSADTVARILEPDCPGLTPLDRLVRDYAVQVTTEPNRIRDGVFTELRMHFTEEQIVELTVRTALCGFFNRVNDALGIGLEEGVIEEMLAKGGREEDLAVHHA